MFRHVTFASFAVATVSGFIWYSTAGSTLAQQQPIEEAQFDGAVEVLTRGPVHEAFAEPVVLERTDPFVVDQAPPPMVEELPPEQRPEGVNVDWIPGYWAWDDSREDYIWISGVWRDIPPNRRWVPGYWSEGQGGWYWTPGFWVSEQVTEVEYLPAPPASLEAGPSVEAPSPDHVWVPGVWRYHETRYAWQPGYWTVVRPDWVWVPARYVWCPTGWVFVDGYWDYPLERRGVLFAPVYYHQPVFTHVHYYYTPTVVIQPDILVVHLFARPGYCHYYFGDYYAVRYRQFGIVPWFSLHVSRVTYDPLFAYYDWHHGRRGRDWYRESRRRYDFFVRHEEFRPAHTFAELRRQRVPRAVDVDVDIQNVVRQTNLAVTLNQYVETVERDVREDRRPDRRGFTRVPEEERRDYVTRARRNREVAERRIEVETGPEPDARPVLPLEDLVERPRREERIARPRVERPEPPVTDEPAEPRDRIFPRDRLPREVPDIARERPDVLPPDTLPDDIPRDERRERARERFERPELSERPGLPEEPVPQDEPRVDVPRERPEVDRWRRPRLDDAMEPRVEQREPPRPPQLQQFERPPRDVGRESPFRDRFEPRREVPRAEPAPEPETRPEIGRPFQRDQRFRDRFDMRRDMPRTDVTPQPRTRPEMDRQFEPPVTRPQPPAFDRGPEQPARTPSPPAIQTDPRFRVPTYEQPAQMPGRRDFRQYQRGTEGLQRGGEPRGPGRAWPPAERRQDFRGRFDAFRQPTEEPPAVPEMNRFRGQPPAVQDAERLRDLRGRGGMERGRPQFQPSPNELRTPDADRGRPFAPREELRDRRSEALQRSLEPRQPDRGRDVQERLGRGADRRALVPQDRAATDVEARARAFRGRGDDERRGRPGRPERPRDDEDDD